MNVSATSSFLAFDGVDQSVRGAGGAENGIRLLVAYELVLLEPLLMVGIVESAHFCCIDLMSLIDIVGSRFCTNFL